MKKSIAIIGAGPSSLMLAAMLDTNKFDVVIYEHRPAPGRKFLVAGKGGFNLTHSEATSLLISRYTPSRFFSKIIEHFNNTDLQNWLSGNGIKTYTGTSKRIFPAKGTKPIEVLNTFLNILDQKGICIKTKHEWKGWTKENDLLFEHNNQETIVKSDIIVFALGGASWKVTGSDGTWTKSFRDKNIIIVPFLPSNCRYEIKWAKPFLELTEGKSLKNISITCNSVEKKGELLITKHGLEGSAIYSLSPEIRKGLLKAPFALIFLDLKPSLTLETIRQKLRQRGNKSFSKLLESELNLNTQQLSLLKNHLSKEEFTDPEILAVKIKELPLKITGFAPIDEAISTVGGIDLNEINDYFELKKLPGHFVIGEMLDWDAPTGGYLLQGCFSMGHYLANYLNDKKV